MNPIIVSLYMGNANKEVISYQRRVVDLFRGSIPFMQYETQFTHGDSMNRIMKYYLNTKYHDTVIFLDIDAIPLAENSFEVLLDMTMNGTTIAGAPQSTNHLPDANGVFVAPSIMAISTDLYYKIECPSAEPTHDCDVAENWSKTYEEKYDTTVSLLDILHFDGSPAPVRLPSGSVISVSHWMLDDSAGTKFGLNTTYGFDKDELFFHSYQSFVPGQNQYFIKKCQSILDKNHCS